MMRTYVLMAALFLTMTALGGCQSRGPATGRAMMPHLAGQWQLVAIDGHKLPATFARKPPTLSIDIEGKVGGFAGVNTFFGEIDVDALDDGLFVIDGIGSTKMAGSREWMELEVQYLRRLGDVDAAIVRGSTLDLTESDEPSLTYKRTGS